MRREAVLAIVLVSLLAVPAQGLPSPSPGPFVPRGPIVIASDADFTAANGVVSGTGTTADPFVIAGWRITAVSSTAITIRNTTAAFLVRDNLLEASTGLSLSAMTSTAVVLNNKLLVRTYGMTVSGVDALVKDNSFVYEPASNNARSIGIFVTDGNARIESNAFVALYKSIVVEKGSPVVVGNDIHSSIGITVRLTTYARIEANVLTAAQTGIYIERTTGTNVTANFITNADAGIDVWISKDINIQNNTVRYSMRTGVSFESASGNFTSNVVVDGSADAVIIWHSPLVMANNTISNNLGIGFHFSMSSANVTGNVFAKNGVGIALNGGDVPVLVANVMVNNTVGISVPYAARQAIVNMSANFVNGVNIDGSVDASQQVYFYKAANVTIVGQVRDSGFGAGYYGSLTAEGGVVLYEVDTAVVNASVIAHHNVGILAVNSFNVQVEGSLLVSNQIGVRAQVVDVPFQVPPCAISVKDSNITIPIDPVATMGIDLQSCFGIVLRTNVSLVDTGIRVNGQSSAILGNVTVTETKVGLDISGRPDEVSISGAVVARNRIGARFVGTVGIVTDSRFEDNAGAGVRLEGGARLAFQRNHVTGNAEGVVDARACAGAYTCSTLAAENNTITGNRGDGVRVNGTSSFRGDVLSDNRGAGARLATGTSLRNVTASGNEGDGVVATGTFDVRGSQFLDNEGSGAVLVGAGRLSDSAFLRNDVAGIRLTGIYVTAERLNVSYNRDGILFTELNPGAVYPALPPLSIPGIYGAVGGGALLGPDPLDVHRSIFLGNERDAIRAGAAAVNATHNYFGPNGPRVSIADQVGAYQNGVSPVVRFVPYYVDPQMTTTGPVFLL